MPIRLATVNGRAIEDPTLPPIAKDPQVLLNVNPDGLRIECHPSTGLTYISAQANKGTPAWETQLKHLANLCTLLDVRDISYGYYRCGTPFGDARQRVVDCVYFNIYHYLFPDAGLPGSQKPPP